LALAGFQWGVIDKHRFQAISKNEWIQHAFVPGFLGGRVRRRIDSFAILVERD
jgi:hypothetical protein